MAAKYLGAVVLMLLLQLLCCLAKQRIGIKATIKGWQAPLRQRIRRHSHQEDVAPSYLDLLSKSVSEGSPNIYPEEAVQGFVKANRRHFILNGKPFYFTGTNAFNLAIHGQYTDSELEEAFSFYATNGFKVIRFFAFSNGFNKSNIFTPKAIQPELGKFDEEALQRIDYILAKGGAVGLRFILVLGNYEPEMGGISWYVQKILGENQESENFFRNGKVKAAYKQYLNKIITRVNTITGKPYSEDPAIMAWEPMNEPHTSDRYEMQRGFMSGYMVHSWLDEMTTYIKSLDLNHLVATGEEGYRTTGKYCWPHFHWINGGEKGVDFAANVLLPNVDFATIHVYPDNWEIPQEEFDWVNENFVADRAAIAHAAGKPIIIEEFGASADYHPIGRDFMFRSLAEAAHSNDVAGMLVWEMWAPSLAGDFYSTGYDFPSNESGITALTEMTAIMNGKTSGVIPLPSLPLAYHLIAARPRPACSCIDVQPPEVGCDIQVEYNKCDDAWMVDSWPPVCDSPQGYCAKSCGRCSCPHNNKTDPPVPLVDAQGQDRSA